MKPRSKGIVHLTVLCLLAGAVPSWANAQDADNNGRSETAAPRLWAAGKFAFSDELGGFTIRSVSGDGSKQNPVIIRQEIHGMGPSVLTVRPLSGTGAPFNPGSTWSTLHMQLETVNQSPAGWIGYLLDLQKTRGEPSVFGDGLSFNQMTRDQSAIRSDAFPEFDIEYEPGDRLVFTGGSLDPRRVARFSFLLLDLSPSGPFYIEQQPQLPAW